MYDLLTSCALMFIFEFGYNPILIKESHMEIINSTSEEENLKFVSEVKPEAEIEIIESIKLLEITSSCTNYNL